MVSRMGCFHSTMLRRWLDSNADVLAHVHDMLVLRSQTFSASLTMWLDFVLTPSTLADCVLSSWSRDPRQQ